MGVVYRATQLALQRVVALKVIAPEFANDPAFRARFKRESLTAALIEHPNVIPVYDAREENGVLFLTMRYVAGTDLRETIAREGRLEPRRAARIVALIASALDAAHAAGLVHRDIKPANILLAYNGGEEQAFLTDFGLTKQTSSESGMTQTGMFVGTVDYVAPEQLQGGPVDARTDIYSLGCVLFQALTGTVPYPRENDLAKLYAHGSAPPPSVHAAAPDVNLAFDPVIVRAMAKDPNDRYLSAGDLGRAALAAADGRTLSRTERNVAEGDAAPIATVVASRPRPSAWPAGETPSPGHLNTLESAKSDAATELVGVSERNEGAAVRPTVLSGPPSQPETRTSVSQATARGRPRARRPRNRILIVAATAFAAAAVLTVALVSGKSSDPPVPNYGLQRTAAKAWALGHYPGTRAIDAAGSLYGCDAARPLDTWSDTGVSAPAIFDCTFFVRGPARAKLNIGVEVHLLTNHPITFAPVTAGDCYETSDRIDKAPCK
jgi:serine/threonine protein kinase